MHIKEFQKIIKTFSDPGEECLVENNKLVISVNDSLIEANLKQKFGDIYVCEDHNEIPASRWIVERLANLKLLANRIIEFTPAVDNFVIPELQLLTTLTTDPEAKNKKIEDGINETQKYLSNTSPLETTILYVTSDAGEGKTSLVNQLARKQAEKFKTGESDFLITPVPLGGRTFMRFDDITVGALQNRYRYPSLYYDSFIELVKMGVIVPAYDGFEEMFVQSSSGEALSAMGKLVGNLDSCGTVIVCTRKAYFEFEDLKSQEKLYQSISQHSVGFGKIEIEKWNKSQFIKYCENTGLDDPEETYSELEKRLNGNHPLLTRPVLVKNLVESAKNAPSFSDFITQLQDAGSNYFSVFVKGILEREAQEKWLTNSGSAESQLMTVEEHVELLGYVASAMWDSKTDYLSYDLLEFVAELFCEQNDKNVFDAEQIKARLSGHALLTVSNNAKNSVEFDHEEFKNYFLAIGLANSFGELSSKNERDVHTTLRMGILPKQTDNHLTFTLRNKNNTELSAHIRFLLGISSNSGAASYSQQNCSSLIINLLHQKSLGHLILKDLTFGPEALLDKEISNIQFINCHFESTSMDHSLIQVCSFDGCNFNQIRLLSNSKSISTRFSEDTKIESVQVVQRNQEYWNPQQIRKYLSHLDLIKEDLQNDEPEANSGFEADIQIQMLQKLLRYFFRSTHISESVIKIKLGQDAKSFLSNTIPNLLTSGVINEIDNRGSGESQRRFKLGLSMEEINREISKAEGSFQKFITQFNNL